MIQIYMSIGTCVFRAQLWILVATTLFSSPARAGQADSPIAPLHGPAIQFPAGSDQAKIPLTRGRNGVFMKLAVNGTDAVWAVLDTGCPITAVDPTIAEKLKLKKVFSSEISLYGGSKGYDLCETDDVRISGLSTGPRHVMTVDLAALRKKGLEIWAVVGVDILREAPFTIDFREPSLTFFKPGTIPEQIKHRGIELELDSPGYKLGLPASLNGQTGHFAIDTGMDSLANVSISLARSLPNPQTARHEIRDMNVQLGGVHRFSMAKFDRIELAGHRFEGPWAEVIDPHDAATAGSSFERAFVGTLGVPAFDDAALTCDCSAHKCWIEWLAPEELGAYLARIKNEEATAVHGLPMIMAALKDRRIDALQSILSRDIDLSVSSGGEFAMEMAARWPEGLKAIIAKGIDPKIKAPALGTALWTAAMEGDVNLVRLLIQSGADLNKTDNVGRTGVFFAASANHPEVVEALLAAGADPNRPAVDKTSPLLAAVDQRADQCIKILLKYHADANAVSDEGHSPLMIAADRYRASTDTVQMLLAAGAKVNLRAKDGGSALMAAINSDNAEQVTLLLDAGADATAKLNDGRTPQDLAIDGVKTHALQALLKMPPEHVDLAGASSSTVSLAWFQSALCARVTIDGKDTGWFGISSQGPQMVIDTRVAERLKLTPALNTSEKFKEKTGKTSTFCRADDIRIGGVSTGPRLMITYDFSRVPFVNGEVSGQIDASLLFDLPCAIDYQKPSITFFKPTAFTQEITHSASPLPADFEGGLSIWGSIQGNACWFKLNTNHSSERFELSNTFARERRSSIPNFHALADFNITPDKIIDQTLLHAAHGEIAGHPFKNFKTTIEDAAEIPPPWTQSLAGSINSISGTGRLFLDARSQRAWHEWQTPEELPAYLKRIESAINSGPTKRPALCSAILDDRIDAATTLINQGAAVNQDYRGYTPLMLAADHPELIKLLLSNGADPNVKAPFMAKTALHFAVEDANVQSVKLLLAGGAKVDQPNSLGQTALYRAAEGNWPEIVEALLAGGANVNSRSKEDITPLMITTDPQTVAVLLKYKADVSFSSAQRAPALVVAAGRGDIAIMKLLIAAGADINKPSQSNSTPLIAAIVKNQLDAMRFLISSGAKTSSPPGVMSPYQIAVENKNPPALRVLRYEAGITPAK